MSVTEITSVEEFRKVVLESQTPVVVDFNADWCGPCQMLKPKIEKLAEGGAKIASVNIDELDDLAEEYEVASIPCLVKFAGGKEIDRKVGLLPEKKVAKFVEDTMVGSDEAGDDDAEVEEA